MINGEPSGFMNPLSGLPERVHVVYTFLGGTYSSHLHVAKFENEFGAANCAYRILVTRSGSGNLRP